MKICVLAISIIALSAISTCKEIGNHRTIKYDQEPLINWFKRRQPPVDAGISLFNDRRAPTDAGISLFKKRRSSFNAGSHLLEREQDPLISWFRERRQDPLISWFNERQDPLISWFNIRNDPTASVQKEEEEEFTPGLSLFKREHHANSKSSKGSYHPQLKLKASSLFKGVLSTKRNDELKSAMFKKASRYNRKFHSKKSSNNNSDMLESEA